MQFANHKGCNFGFLLCSSYDSEFKLLCHGFTNPCRPPCATVMLLMVPHVVTLHRVSITEATLCKDYIANKIAMACN